MNYSAYEAIAALIGLVWALSQLRRPPRRRSLWLVTAGLVAAEVVYLLSVDSVAAAIDHAAGNGVAVVLENLAVMVFHFLVIWFFLHVAGASLARIRRQAAFCALACGALIAANLAIPAAERGLAPSQSVLVAVFYLIPSLYVGYALTVEIRAAWRYARVSEPPLSHGLWIITVALAGKLAGGPAYRGAGIVAIWLGHEIPRGTSPVFNALLGFGIVVFPLGIAYAGLAGRVSAARRWWQHRAAYRGLEPLWRVMHEAFPEDSLHRVPTGRWERFTSFQSMHRRYYRRVIECRDGLVRISPYLPRAGGGTEQMTADEWAVRLWAGLRARDGQLPPPGQPVVIAGPRGSDLDADVEQLLALSHALTSSADGAFTAVGVRPGTRG